jgi:hypothetical protein
LWIEQEEGIVRLMKQCSSQFEVEILGVHDSFRALAVRHRRGGHCHETSNARSNLLLGRF